MLNVFICVLVILLLNLYLGNIESTRKQLANLPDAIPVYCRITNLNGSQEVGLDIEEELILNLKSSSHVKNTICTVRLMAGVDDFPIEEWKKYLKLSILGTNSIQAVAGLAEDAITLKDGINFDFLESSTLQCILSQELMENNQWEIGDHIPLKLFYYRRTGQYQVNVDPLELMSFEIVGSMTKHILTTGEPPPDILLPFETVSTG